MRIIITILIVLLIALFGCDSNYVLETDTIPETITVYETVIQTQIVEVENTDRINELELEVQAYKDLIGNLNELLSCVYYGYASNSNWILDGFTAFSLAYNGKYYLITAGHAVEQQSYGKFGNFKFKANFSNDWIYPELLKYNPGIEDVRNDYAVFYTSDIKSGLKPGEYILPAYTLGTGNLNLIRDNFKKNIPGESGSPIININGEVLGMVAGEFTDISFILQGIDSIN